MDVLTPRYTNMRRGHFRPEIVVDDGLLGDVVLLEPTAADADSAWERACDAIELIRGEWTDSGRRYVCLECRGTAGALLRMSQTAGAMVDELRAAKAASETALTHCRRKERAAR